MPPTLPPSFPAPAPLTPGPLAGTDWQIVSVQKGASTRDESWSPDGAHLLILNYNDYPPAVLSDADGSVVRQYDQGTFGAWLDSDRFVLLTYTNAEGGEQAKGLLASVASAKVDAVDVPYGEALSSGHGAIAFVSSGCDLGCDNWTYAVWTPEDRSSQRLPGEPIGWSPDGQRLFIIRPPSYDGPPVGAPGRAATVGWLEVVSWPGLQSVAQYKDITVNDDIHTIDPSGRYMTFLGDDGLYVVDTREGTSTPMPVTSWNTAWQGSDLVIGAPQVDPAWLTDSKGHDLIVTPARGVATLMSVVGGVLGSWDDVGSGVANSPDGTTVAMWDTAFSDSRPFVTVIRNGNRSELEQLPADGYIVSCGQFAIQLSDQDLVAECIFNERLSDATERVILVHPL